MAKRNRPQGKMYVVFRGTKPGIFDNWPQCHQQVHGFPRNLYRSFETYEDVLAAWHGYWENLEGEPMPQYIHEAGNFHEEAGAHAAQADGSERVHVFEANNAIEQLPPNRDRYGFVGGMVIGVSLTICFILLAMLMY